MVTREWKGDPGVLPPGKSIFRFVIFSPQILPYKYKDFGLTNFIRSIAIIMAAGRLPRVT